MADGHRVLFGGLMANSKRKCGYCGQRKPAESMHIVGVQAFCNVDHWIENQVKNKDRLVKKGDKILAKIEREEKRQRKEKLKTRAQWANDAQVWVNKYIRLRDAGLPCISCGSMMNEGGYTGAGGIHAGHYRSRGACPELRYEELNIHNQCARCNNELSGNQIEYRKGLIAKIGQDKVEWLEGPHDPKKYTIDDLKEIIAKYKQKCKEFY